ncbi:hypothetical protein D3C86_1952350 [compost metagenome]
MSVARGEVSEELHRAIATPVVDEDQLVVLGHPVHYRRESAVEFGDDGFLVEDGNDDRNQHASDLSYLGRPILPDRTRGF